MFDKYTIFSGLPLPGQKIKFIKPAKFGWFKDVLDDEKNLLVPGQEYTVRKVNLNSSSTYVYLEEFWVEGLDEYRNNQKCFNMHSFSWDTPPFDPAKLVGFNVNDCYELNNKPYKFGVENNGKLLCAGSPIVSVISDDKGTILEAKFR